METVFKNSPTLTAKSTSTKKESTPEQEDQEVKKKESSTADTSSSPPSQKFNTTVLGQGENKFGQLGIGSLSETSFHASPVEVSFFRSNFISLRQISLGGGHCLAVSVDGNVFAWGNNSHWQCGVGESKEAMILTPTLLPNLREVIQVAAGGSHSLAVQKDGGHVFSWGSDSYYQLGLENGGNVPSPTRIPNLKRIMQVSAGGSHSLVLTQSGQVLAFGNNNCKQTGVNESVSYIPKPTLLPELDHVVQVSAGSLFSLARLRDGSVYGWGSDELNQLNLLPSGQVAKPTQIPNLANIRHISAGNSSSLAVNKDGQVFFWGTGFVPHQHAPLHASRALHHSIKPTKLEIHQDVKFVAAFAGLNHSFAVSDSGLIVGWGKNLQFQGKEVARDFNAIAVSFECDSWLIYSTSEENVMPSKPQSTFFTDLKTALNKQNFADVVLVSNDGKQFPAHRIFLSVRTSPEFQAEIRSSSSERDQSEGTSDVHFYTTYNQPTLDGEETVPTQHEEEEAKRKGKKGKGKVKSVYVPVTSNDQKASSASSSEQQPSTEVPSSIPNEIHLPFPAPVVEAFLQYVYSDSIPLESPAVNAQLLELAHHYRMTVLKQWCERALAEALQPENAAMAYLHAFRSHSEKLQMQVKRFIFEHFGEVTQTPAWNQELLQHSPALQELFSGIKKETMIK